MKGKYTIMVCLDGIARYLPKQWDRDNIHFYNLYEMIKNQIEIFGNKVECLADFKELVKFINVDCYDGIYLVTLSNDGVQDMRLLNGVI